MLLRLKEDYDGAEPAAASVTVRNLITLGHLTADDALLAHAERTLERYGHGDRPRRPRDAVHGGERRALAERWTVQVAIAGDARSDSVIALERAVAAKYLPFAVVVPVHPGAEQAALGERWPWLGGDGVS